VEDKAAAYEEKVRSTRSEHLGRNKELVKEGADKAKEIIDETALLARGSPGVRRCRNIDRNRYDVS
jgi:hypothetical protein